MKGAIKPLQTGRLTLDIFENVSYSLSFTQGSRSVRLPFPFCHTNLLECFFYTPLLLWQTSWDAAVGGSGSLWKSSTSMSLGTWPLSFHVACFGGILKHPPAKKDQCTARHSFHFNVLQTDLIFLCHPPSLFMDSAVFILSQKTETNSPWSSLHLKMTAYSGDVYPNNCSTGPVWGKSHFEISCSIYHNNVLYDRCIWHITIYYTRVLMHC